MRKTIRVFRTEVGVDHGKLAWVLHSVAPPASTPWELCHIAALRWDDLSDQDLGEVLERVKEIREVRRAA